MSNGSAGAFQYVMFSSGIVRVDVTAASVRLYVWDLNTRSYENTTGTFLTSNGENYPFAFKAN